MPRKSRKNVGLIGLGIIGSRVAAGLRASGFHVFVWNRTAKPAPNFVGSAAELAELCDIIQIFVADAQALFDVIEQMRDVLTPQHVIVCNATVGPEATIEAARIVEEAGAHFLDAPFTGSKAAAEKRALVYYIGGDEATFLRARPVLEATSKAIVRIGGVGHAATIKVVTNMIAAVSIQTLGEALAIVQKAGLDPEVLAAALEQNACRSATMDMKLPKMIAGDYEPHFSLKHMFKDVQLGIHVANALDIEIPATTVTAGVMYGALNQGWGDLDFSALYKIYGAQRTGESGTGELGGGAVQLEDLDPREVHYPETTVPAPPRPGTESPAREETVDAEVIPPTPEAPAPAATEPKPALPSLASALSAPEEIRATDPAPPVAKHPLDAPVLASTIPGAILLAPAVQDSLGENIVLAGAPAEVAPEPAASVPEPAVAEKSEPAPEAKAEPSPLSPPEPAAEAKPSTPEPAGPTPVAERNEPPAAPPEALAGQHAPNFRVVDTPPGVEATSESAAAPNGNGDFGSNPNGTTKPFNFVKRWFVARTGS